MAAAAAVELSASGGGRGTTAAGTVGSRTELGPGRTAVAVSARCLSLLCGPGRAAAPSGGHSCFTLTTPEGAGGGGGGGSGSGGGKGRGCGATVTPVTAGGSNRAAFSCGSGGRRSNAASALPSDSRRNICSMLRSVVGVRVGVVSVGTPAALLLDPLAELLPFVLETVGRGRLRESLFAVEDVISLASCGWVTVELAGKQRSIDDVPISLASSSPRRVPK